MPRGRVRARWRWRRARSNARSRSRRSGARRGRPLGRGLPPPGRGGRRRGRDGRLRERPRGARRPAIAAAGGPARAERRARARQPGVRAAGADGGAGVRRGAPGSLPRRARTVLTGNPVRADILAVATDRDRLAKEARAELELDEGKRTVVVFGGSQGRAPPEPRVRRGVGVLDRSDLQVVLLTGPAHVEAVRASLPAGGTVTVRVQGSSNGWSSRTRSPTPSSLAPGATTVAEIGVSGLPSLLVPYPYATGRHQEANARALQRAGAATMLLDDELDGRVLADRIEWLLSDDRRLRSMGERAARGRGRTPRTRSRGRCSRRGMGDERLPSAARLDPDAGGAGPRRRPARAHDRHRRRGHAQPRSAVPGAGCRGDGFGPEGLGGCAGAPGARGDDRHRSRGGEPGRRRRGRRLERDPRRQPRARRGATSRDPDVGEGAGPRRRRDRPA